ncbi:unnamed protein product [Discosporangium mesarthrocarpum]
MSLGPEASSFSFPVLSLKQLLQNLSALNIHATEEMLMVPEKYRDDIVKVFERLVEASGGGRREEMNQPVFAGYDCLSYPELHQESIPELAFFEALSKMMKVSLVDDFSLMDLRMPTKKRIRRHLSAAINYCRFHQERVRWHEEFVTHYEASVRSLQQAQEDTVAAQNELESLQEQAEEEAKAVKKKEEECKELLAKTSSISSKTKELRAEAQALKREANDLKDDVAAVDLELQQAKMEKERLLGLVVNSPRRIKRDLKDKQETLTQEQASGAAAEENVQRMKTEVSNLTRAEKDVQKALKAIGELEAQLNKQKEALKEFKSTHAAVNAKKAKCAQKRLEVQTLERQLHRFEEKLSNLRKQTKVKNEASKENIEGMQAELVEVERVKDEALAGLEAAEACEAQVERALAEERARHETQEREMAAWYHKVEEVILSHSHSVIAAIEEEEAGGEELQGLSSPPSTVMA